MADSVKDVSMSSFSTAPCPIDPWLIVLTPVIYADAKPSSPFA